VSGDPSMAVFKLAFAEGFEWLLPVDERDFESLRFDGHPRAQSWRPVRMKRLRVSEPGRRLRPSDFPACSGGDMLIVSEAAREQLGKDLEHYGELLPLACKEANFWALNVTRFVNALDENASQLVRASDTGAVLTIRKLVLMPAKLGEAELFKLPQTPRGLIYATRLFADKVQQTGLRGLEFVQVWPPT